jgi:hypothetical protein
MCLPGVRPEFLIRGLRVLGLLYLTLSKWDFFMFFNINFLKTGIPVFNTMKNCVCTSFSQISARTQLVSAWK